MSRRSAAAHLAAVLLALASAGCGEQPRTPAARGADDLGLSAVTTYGRHSAVRGKVDVRFTNAGTSAVELEALQLRSPLFATVPRTERPTTLQADGRPSIVPVDFGEVRCEGQNTAGTATGDVLVAVRTEEGVEDVAVPVVDGEPGLRRAHRLACAAAAVDDAVSLDLGPPWERVETPAGPRLRTVLRTERRGDGEVEVTQLLGSILFGVDVAAPVLRLADDAGAAEAEVVVAATRCDPHARIESKTSFTFPVFARLDGGEEVATSVTASGAGKDALQALLDDTCGAP